MSLATRMIKPRGTQGASEPRPEELRLLEAMLFAASEPLSEKDLSARLPEGVDVGSALSKLQEEYDARRQPRSHLGKMDVPHRS